MSRKRPSKQSNSIQSDAQAICDEYDTYEYYSPGCYCTPQVVVGHPTPYCCNYQQDYPVQWNGCNAATYVVDAYGMVYYLSDFEHQMQLPNNLTVETEISYHYHYDKDECSDDMDDEASVSPRKRERFDENECNLIDKHSVVGSLIDKEPKLQEEKSNVYRSEQGYLVEEPNDSDEPCSK